MSTGIECLDMIQEVDAGLLDVVQFIDTDDWRIKIHVVEVNEEEAKLLGLAAWKITVESGRGVELHFD